MSEMKPLDGFDTDGGELRAQSVSGHGEIPKIGGTPVLAGTISAASLRSRAFLRRGDESWLLGPALTLVLHFQND
jgi:hypothetical protein